MKEELITLCEAILKEMEGWDIQPDTPADRIKKLAEKALEKAKDDN